MCVAESAQQTVGVLERLRPPEAELTENSCACTDACSFLLLAKHYQLYTYRNTHTHTLRQRQGLIIDLGKLMEGET